MCVTKNTADKGSEKYAKKITHIWKSKFKIDDVPDATFENR